MLNCYLGFIYVNITFDDSYGLHHIMSLQMLICIFLILIKVDFFYLLKMGWGGGERRWWLIFLD